MDKKCKNRYEKLNALKRWQAEYWRFFIKCAAKGDLLPVRKKKDDLKAAIGRMRKLIYKRLSEVQRVQLGLVKQRFFLYPTRHVDIYNHNELWDRDSLPRREGEAERKDAEQIWPHIEKRLRKRPVNIDVLIRMEDSGGEPDVVWYDGRKDKYIFVDCSRESPKGRAYVCYDREAEKSAKSQGLDPKGNVVDLAAQIGIKILSRPQYVRLQELEEFDVNSQSWIRTSSALRRNDEALIGGRFAGVAEFFEIEAADCSYGPRGFRGYLEV